MGQGDGIEPGGAQRGGVEKGVDHLVPGSEAAEDPVPLENEQKNGPFSTEDVFSIFNGASLGFYELETIAPMIAEDGKFVSSTVRSETFIYKGSASALAALLEKEYLINAKEIIK